MYEYRLVEKYLGHHIVFPGRGFTYITYEISEPNLAYLYSIGHPCVKRVRKKTKKKKIKPENKLDNDNS